MQAPCVLFHDVILSDDVYLEPKKEYLIFCAIDKTQHNTNTYMFTPYMEKNEKKNIVAATSIVAPNEGIIPVRVMNCDKVGLKLYMNTVIGKVENLIEEHNAYRLRSIQNNANSNDLSLIHI